MLVYGGLKFAPAWLRPRARSLFLWQDQGFDAWVGRRLDPCDFFHAMPGQALRGFEQARRLGARRVLNHATGPASEWVRIMEPEYRRVGLNLTDICPYDANWFNREAQEYEMASFHCAASTVVRDQLLALGIAPDRIWVVGYGADPAIFHARGRKTPDRFRLVFAGQAGLRKGIKTLLDALEKLDRPDWEMHFYGGVADEARPDLASYRGRTPLTLHGAVSQESLAEAFRGASLLGTPFAGGRIWPGGATGTELRTSMRSERPSGREGPHPIPGKRIDFSQPGFHGAGGRTGLVAGPLDPRRRNPRLAGTLPNVD